METEERPNSTPPKKTRRKLWALALIFAALIAFALGILGAQLFGRPAVKVPEAVANKVTFPIYLPSELPGNFTLNADSFSFQEGALIYKATDSTGATIAFTEQARKPDFDFAGFYSVQIKEPETLSNVPWPSVFGKARGSNASILSVVADETWLFVSTLAPLTAEDMQTIAGGLKLYR
jgi:hypothetical protein